MSQVKWWIKQERLDSLLIGGLAEASDAEGLLRDGPRRLYGLDPSKGWGRGDAPAVVPQTGRVHRCVHCLSMGHPILGDPLYAPETVADYPRMMLHAEELRINHPENGKGMKFLPKSAI